MIGRRFVSRALSQVNVAIFGQEVGFQSRPISKLGLRDSTHPRWLIEDPLVSRGTRHRDIPDDVVFVWLQLEAVGPYWLCPNRLEVRIRRPRFFREIARFPYKSMISS